MVKIHSLYVSYLLPMTCEFQYWEFPEPEAVRAATQPTEPSRLRAARATVRP